MNLLKLTRPDGKPTYISADQVCAVDLNISSAYSASTVISLVNGKVQAVKEDIETVISMLGDH